jgi:hypothetical protein
VRAAHERLRQAVSIALAVSPAVRVEARPLVEGHAIVLEPHLVPPEASAVRYLYGVDMVLLCELAPGASQVPDWFEAYCRRAPAVPLHDFLSAVSTAVARGWLVSQ